MRSNSPPPVRRDLRHAHPAHLPRCHPAIPRGRPGRRLYDPFYRTVRTVSRATRPRRPIAAVHRPVDSLCRHAADRCAQHGDSAVDIDGDTRPVNRACLRKCPPPAVREQKLRRAGPRPRWPEVIHIGNLTSNVRCQGSEGSVRRGHRGSRRKAGGPSAALPRVRVCVRIQASVAGYRPSGRVRRGREIWTGSAQGDRRAGRRGAAPDAAGAQELAGRPGRGLGRWWRTLDPELARTGGRVRPLGDDRPARARRQPARARNTGARPRLADGFPDHGNADDGRADQAALTSMVEGRADLGVQPDRHLVRARRS